jgi:hypothetical protein
LLRAAGNRDSRAKIKGKFEDKVKGKIKRRMAPVKGAATKARGGAAEFRESEHLFETGRGERVGLTQFKSNENFFTGK